MLSIKKNLAYNFLLSLSQVLLPLVSIPYISRILTPEGIGKVSFIDSFTYYFVSIAEFGIVVYGMREVARLRDDPPARDRAVSGLLSLHVLTSAISICLYSIAVFFLWQKIQDIRLLFFSFSFLLVNAFACEWYFLGMERFRYIMLRSLITRLLGLASLFLLVRAPEDYFLYYAIITGSAIVNGLWNSFYLFREVRISFRNIPWRRYAFQTRYTYAISLLADVTLILDVVFLRLLSLPAAVGLYAFSMKIVRTSSSLLTDSLLVFFPRVVALVRAEAYEEVKALVRRNIQLLLFFGIPMTLGIFVVAEPLVLVVLGPQFLPAVPNLQLLAFYLLLRVYNLFLSKQALIAHGQEKAYVKSLLLGAGIFVAATIPLSWRYADLGACMAILLSELATLLLNLYYCRRLVSYLPVWDNKSFLQALAASLPFVLLAAGLNHWLQAPLPVLLTAIPLCAAVYILIQGWGFRNELAMNARTTFTDYFLRRS
ncbi:MAG: oligosaccharide flippase family protein [Candidatus Pseudobacter hemicellulosilyticus]|uniref:Oligosaccharide flippase family protein n=1 Tax=Candidatus Pseudobacter hemicellulosilyticus TaxID=3121375 RepID=A0AAJ5WU22_9BACT|nr:MAG: oligosaccharide flippase family protein [Pseudobacter sp.]